ncbi:MAG: diaminopimelate epimerase, partial [Planctomycetes bacterium]|nr:diaminopimelate epimerase [Planctomycetota bacterium]
MRFVKIEGAGNDYVLVETFCQRVDDPAALARAVSDRHSGIGSDGLILVGPPGAGGAHARMRMFNADGSEGLMCGNGLRCVVRWLAQEGRAPADGMAVETAA